jgi:hypothetical protein
MLARSIKGRLFSGFGAICVVIAISAGISSLLVGMLDRRSHIAIGVHLPAAQETARPGTSMASGVHRTGIGYWNDRFKMT